MATGPEATTRAASGRAPAATGASAVRLRTRARAVQPPAPARATAAKSPDTPTTARSPDTPTAPARPGAVARADAAGMAARPSSTFLSGPADPAAELTARIRTVIRAVAPLLDVASERVPVVVDPGSGPAHGAAPASSVHFTGSVDPARPAGRALIVHELAHVRQHANRAAGRRADVTAAEREAAGLAAAARHGRPLWVPRQALPDGHVAHDTGAAGLSPDIGVPEVERDLEALAAQNHLDAIEAVAGRLDPQRAGQAQTDTDNSLRALDPLSFLVVRALIRAVRPEIRRRLAGFDDEHHRRHPEACIAVLSALDADDLRQLPARTDRPGNPAAAAVHGAQPDRLSATAHRALLGVLGRLPATARAELEHGDRAALFTRLFQTAPGPGSDAADLAAALRAEQDLAARRSVADQALGDRPEPRRGAREGAEGPAGSRPRADRSAASGPTPVAGAPAAAEPAPDIEPPTPDGSPRRARAARQVELLMPPAPAGPGPADRERLDKATRGAKRAAARAKDLPTVPQTVDAARHAVEEPPVETTARAGQRIADALGRRIPPVAALEKLADEIVKAVRERRPPEEELTKSKAYQAAQGAGQTIAGAVGGEAKRLQHSYDSLVPEPTGQPQLTPQPLRRPGSEVADPSIKAASVAPRPIPDENLSLDADRDRVEREVAAARIDRHTTEPLQGTSPFSDVAQGRADLAALATEASTRLAKQQAEAIATAETDMAGLQERALQALTESRGRTVTGVHGGQRDMVRQEHKTRESLTAEALGHYNRARKDVEPLLKDLPGTAFRLWDTGLAELSTEFTQHLAKVQSWVDERHSGVGGYFLGKWDRWTGLPGWVTKHYNAAEEKFGTGVRDLLLKIGQEVNSVLAAAEAAIAKARTRIDGVFTGLDGDLAQWAEGEHARFQRQLDGLSARVEDTRTSFVRDLSQRAITAVTEVQDKVERLRTEARGIIGRIIDFVEDFLDDPIKTIINGLLNLLGIAPKAFWALVDKIAAVVDQIAENPEGFVNNLVAGLREGFNLFFDHFPRHLLAGFWGWLTSGLGPIGVQLPTDMSPRSLFAFVLQVMGLTWPNIREILVRHVGPKNVELIEKAWQLISLLIAKGPDGIVEMLKEKLEPATILDAIVDAAIDYATTRLIKAVTVKVLSMFNPVGAVLQAVKLIWTVLKWVFENAARIFTLIETVVDGIADVLAGNVDKLALAVERALAGLVAPVVDFLAGLADLDDLPLEIADVIKDLRKVVLDAADLVIGTLVERAQALLASVGLGGKPAEQAGDEEVGTTIRFTAAGELHRLYVEVTASGAHLMVSSVPEQVHDKIKGWRAKITTGVPADEKSRARATELLDRLGPVVGNADDEAARLAKEFLAAKAEAEQGHPLPSDDALENRERAIAAMLDELFTIFGEQRDVAQLLVEMATVLPVRAHKRIGTVHGHWHDRLAGVTFETGAGQQRLWVDGVLAGTEGAALSYVSLEPTHRKLLPYFTTAALGHGVDTDAFADYALVSSTAPHTVRRDFNRELGQAAVGELVKKGAERLAAALSAKRIDDKYHDLFVKNLSKVDFDPESRDGGRFILWTGDVPDHTLFRPLNMTTVENDQVRTTTYHTVVRTHFTVVTDRSQGLEVRVGGLGLRKMSGRGVTEDSPWFTSGQGFNRAHAIANEFGGPGYAEGENLATTSAKYNQETMRDAERQIAASLKRFASRKGGYDLEDVTFDLDVRIRFGELRDPVLLAMIKQHPDFPAAKAGTDLDAEILAKIKSGEVHPELRRVIGVDYEWTAWLPPGPGFAILRGSTSIGPDLWLLING